MSKFLVKLTPARTAITHARASNEQFKPTTRPVALFLGGTSGIGQAMAEQLARQTNGRAQIVLLGRNQEAADRIIATFPRTPDGTSPGGESKYSFVKVDATSMAQIRSAAAKLSTELDKINFIVVTAGYSTLKGRDETPEGIDRKMACNFYARFRFIHDLVPLVHKAAERGEQTGVMSVFDAGSGSAIDLDDLGLTKGFTLRKAHDHVVTYKDAVFEVRHIPIYLTLPNAAYPSSAPGIRISLSEGLFQPCVSGYGHHTGHHQGHRCPTYCSPAQSNHRFG